MTFNLAQSTDFVDDSQEHEVKEQLASVMSKKVGSLSAGPDKETRDFWWSTWRSIFSAQDDVNLSDISDALAVFGTYRISKISDYSSLVPTHRPTLANWLSLHRGRVGLETFIIYLGKKKRWIAVSGHSYLDLSKSSDPLPTSKGERDRARIELIYRVTESSSLCYSSGYKDGYESGLSQSKVKAREEAQKEIWKKAYEQGKSEARLDWSPRAKWQNCKLVGALCFSVGVALTSFVIL